MNCQSPTGCHAWPSNLQVHDESAVDYGYSSLSVPLFAWQMEVLRVSRRQGYPAGSPCAWGWQRCRRCRTTFWPTGWCLRQHPRRNHTKGSSQRWPWRTACSRLWTERDTIVCNRGLAQDGIPCWQESPPDWFELLVLCSFYLWVEFIIYIHLKLKP